MGSRFLAAALLSVVCMSTARAQYETADVNGVSLRYDVSGTGEPLNRAVCPW